MNKIISIHETIKLSKKFRQEGKNIVVAGGVFDILHQGHILFLENAKKCGDVLFVLLESNRNAKRKKGENRPIHAQKDRAFVLSALKPVDYVVLLNDMTNDSQYDKLITEFRPNIIATTEKDKESRHKERQAKVIGAKVIYVIKRIMDQSTTKMEKLVKAL